jgi:parallel beta-helix repeat protein
MHPKRRLVAALATVVFLSLTGTASATVSTYDSFTEFTSGVLLENHTGETGATWARHPSYAATPLTIANGQVWGSQGALYYASGVPSTNEYSVVAQLWVASNSGSTGLVARASTTADTYYRGGYNASTGKWELSKCVSSACTVLSSSPATLDTGGGYQFQLQVLNSQKTLYVSGVPVASSADNTITQTGRAGIRTGPGVVNSTTGYQLDEFEAYSEADTSITAGPSGATSNASPSFSFASSPTGGTFECDLDAAGGEDSWIPCTSPTTYSGLTQGTHTFRVRATVAGTTDSTPATRSFTVDTTAPNTTITSGPSGATSSTAPSFGFSSTEAGSFQCKLDGPGATVGTYAACTSPKAYSGLAQGSYTVSVRATDTAGNPDASPATRSFTVDTTAPDTTITAGPSGQTTSTAPSFSFSSNESGATFECKLDGPAATVGAYGACTSPKAYSSLANGSYTFSVRAKDAAANTDATPATSSFTVSPCNQTASPGGPITTPNGLVAALSPGQTGCLRAGTYSDAATETAVDKLNVTLMSYPGELATIKGRVVVKGTGDGVTIKDLRLDGVNTSNNPSPTINGTDVTIAHNDISNRDLANPSTGGGICVHPSLYSGSSGDRFIIERNRIHDCGVLPANTVDQGIYVADAGNGIIRNNVIYDVANRGIQFRVSAHDNEAYNNTIDGNAPNVLYGGPAANNVVHDNIISNSLRYNVEQYQLTGSGNVLRDNCLWASTGSSFYDQGGTGIDPGLVGKITITGNVVQNPSYVNRAGKDFRDTNAACAGKGAPDDVAMP